VGVLEVCQSYVNVTHRSIDEKPPESELQGGYLMVYEVLIECLYVSIALCSIMPAEVRKKS